MNTAVKVVITPAASRIGEGHTIDTVPKLIGARTDEYAHIFVPKERYAAQIIWAQALYTMRRLLKNVAYEGSQIFLKKPPTGYRALHLLYTNEEVFGFMFAHVRCGKYSPTTAVQYVPIFLLKGEGNGLTDRKVWYNVLHGDAQTLKLLTSYDAFGFKNVVKSTFSTRPGPGSKALYLLIHDVEGEGANVALRDVQTLNTIVAPERYLPLANMEVYYLGASDSQPQLTVTYTNGTLSDQTITMEPVADGIFKAVVQAPSSGLMVLKVEDQTYNIFAVKICELDRAASKEDTELFVDAFYDEDTHLLTVTVWFTVEDVLHTFTEEDTVFIEIHTPKAAISMVNVKGTGDQFVVHRELITEPDTFVIKASFKGCNAIKVVPVTGSSASSEAGDFVILT